MSYSRRPESLTWRQFIDVWERHVICAICSTVFYLNLMSLVPAQCGHMWLAFQIPSDVYMFLQIAMCCCGTCVNSVYIGTHHWFCYFIFWKVRRILKFVELINGNIIFSLVLSETLFVGVIGVPVCLYFKIIFCNWHKLGGSMSSCWKTDCSVSS